MIPTALLALALLAEQPAAAAAERTSAGASSVVSATQEPHRPDHFMALRLGMTPAEFAEAVKDMGLPGSFCAGTKHVEFFDERTSIAGPVELEGSVLQECQESTDPAVPFNPRFGFVAASFVDGAAVSIHVGLRKGFLTYAQSLEKAAAAYGRPTRSVTVKVEGVNPGTFRTYAGTLWAAKPFTAVIHKYRDGLADVFVLVQNTARIAELRNAIDRQRASRDSASNAALERAAKDAKF